MSTLECSVEPEEQHSGDSKHGGGGKLWQQQEARRRGVAREEVTGSSPRRHTEGWPESRKLASGAEEEDGVDPLDAVALRSNGWPLAT